MGRLSRHGIRRFSRREAGGVIFAERPNEEQLKQFFFEFARFRPPEDAESQYQALHYRLIELGISQLKLAPQPLRLDGIGQGVRGVSALWNYSKATAGITDLLSRRPIEVKVARRTAQQLVDACAVEQDLLIGLALSGESWSSSRNAVDCAIFAAAVGRGLGLSAVQCSDSNRWYSPQCRACLSESHSRQDWRGPGCSDLRAQAARRRCVL